MSISIEPIDFEAILAEITAMPVTERDPNHFLAVNSTRWGSASHEYDVRVPIGYEDGIDETELITRCDNKTHDLREDAGQRCHFGGNVKWVNENYAKVTVWVD